MRAAKVDSNHAGIVRSLRARGYGVQSLAAIGGGCPDLLVGLDLRNWLLEIKDGSKRPSKRRLTDDQVEWHRTWPGQVAVVETLEEALVVLEAQLEQESERAGES